MSGTEATNPELYEMFGNPVENFVPFAVYNSDGDCVEFYAKNEKYYGERINDYVTVYRAVENDEIIGSVIKNVRSLCAELSANNPTVTFVVKDQCICIQHLFFFWWKQHAETIPVYQKLTELAVNNRINDVRLFC